MQNQNLPLNALRAFAAIYETGGIRSAARTLDVTHSSISRHLRFLEDSLGVALIDRDQNQRSLSFTVQGERLGQSTTEALLLLSNAIINISEDHQPNSIIISTAPSFASRWLMEKIHEFNKKYPWIEVSVLVDQQLTKPADQGADIGIRIGDGAWAECEYRLLMDDTLFPVSSPGYAKRLGNTNDLSFLKKAKLLHDRDSQTSWDVWRTTFNLDWFDSTLGPRFTSTDMVLDASSKGLGVALARGRMAERELLEGSLIRLAAPNEIKIPGAYWILEQSESADRIAVKTFVNWLKEQCAKPAQWSKKETTNSIL
ncbi:MAG: LysR substrate-binding domain-containing protein [Paracoccaceae bacterium]